MEVLVVPFETAEVLEVAAGEHDEYARRNAGRISLARIVCPRPTYYAQRLRIVSLFCVYQADHADVDGESPVIVGVTFQTGAAAISML